MKILLCNIAIRSKPDHFPPVACTSLFNVLKRSGYEVSFYDINAIRPSFSELSEFFKSGKFDIVAISAVVSTGYQVSKNLANLIKDLFPQTQIILGGNLAAAYEIILRKSKIDVCVIGEGEKVIMNLVRYYEAYGNFKATDELLKIKGVVFLGEDGCVRCSGPEEPLGADEIEQPDYGLLEDFSDIDLYIFDPFSQNDFSHDSRSYEPKRRNKKGATILTSKGCVNSCSFCHRWVKGYRVIPVNKVIEYIKLLMNRYNVGFLNIGDECFGEDRIWVDEFIRLIKPLDVLFQIGGARVSMLDNDPSILRRLKEVGLTAIYFGIESGSDKILRIMNKNATKAENLAALISCRDAEIYSVIQLVIGMPGENDDTIAETIDFIKKATEQLLHPPLVTVNYLQALPGTACYKFLKQKGLVGATVDDEEKYLLGVSNIDASEFRQYVNVSEAHLSKVKLWKLRIRVLPVIHWLKLHGWKFPIRRSYEQHISYEAIHSLRQYLKKYLKNNVFLYRIIDMSGEWFWKIALVACK